MASRIPADWTCGDLSGVSDLRSAELIFTNKSSLCISPAGWTSYWLVLYLLLLFPPLCVPLTSPWKLKNTIYVYICMWVKTEKFDTEASLLYFLLKSISLLCYLIWWFKTVMIIPDNFLIMLTSTHKIKVTLRLCATSILWLKIVWIQKKVLDTCKDLYSRVAKIKLWQRTFLQITCMFKLILVITSSHCMYMKWTFMSWGKRGWWWSYSESSQFKTVFNVCKPETTGYF